MTRPTPALLERLASADPAERRRACLAAAQSPSAVLLADALGEALGDPEKAVARAASDALVEIATRIGDVQSAVRKALRSEVPSRRWGAALTAARIDPPGPRLLPPLVEALGSADGDVRWAAARVIVETGRLHGEVLPLLLALVRNGERAIQRRMAIFALRELAPDRIEAAEALLDATRDTDLQVRRAAFTAMASLTDPLSGIPTRLLEAVHEDDDAASRRLAALSLGEIGRENPRAISPEAIRQLRDVEEQCQDPDLRRALQRTLGRIDSSHRVALDAPPTPGYPHGMLASPLILASASPRRRDLLSRLKVPFASVPAEIAEIARPGEAPQALAERLAREKAEAVVARVGTTPRRVVLGSDTIVVIGEEVLGKPRDPEHALVLLRKLCGRTHRVMTGIAVVESDTGRTRSRVVESRVTLRKANEAELRDYVATGESLDKAGAYALQGAGRRFIAAVEGSETNVIGLPLEETLAMLQDAGVEIPEC